MPQEAAMQPEEPTKTEETAALPVTSAQYGQLLEDLAAEAVKPMTRRDPIWRVDAPTENVQAVAMVRRSYREITEAMVLDYDAAENTWSSEGIKMHCKVMGWFPVPRWEV